MNFRQTFVSGIVAVLLGTLGGGPVWAVPISSDRLLVTDAAGNVLVDSDPSGRLSEAGFAGAEEFNTTQLILPPFGPLGGMGQVLVFLDPGTNDVSDRLGVSVGTTVNTSVVTFGIISDFGEVPVGGTTLLTTLETGNLDDVTGFLTILTGSGLTVRVQSDVEAVPEAATWALLGSGLVGLASVAWRRHRK